MVAGATRVSRDPRRNSGILSISTAYTASTAIVVTAVSVRGGRRRLGDVDAGALRAAFGAEPPRMAVVLDLKHRATDHSPTCSGTFHANSRKSQDVSGGGTWQAFSPGGAPTSSGTYEVTGFVDFELAPGRRPSRSTSSAISPTSVPVLRCCASPTPTAATAPSSSAATSSGPRIRSSRGSPPRRASSTTGTRRRHPLHPGTRTGRLSTSSRSGA
jgi:hypothetical protein